MRRIWRAEILQRIAQQMNDIAEQIAAFALDCAAAMRRVLESEALQEALQAALPRDSTRPSAPAGQLRRSCSPHGRRTWAESLSGGRHHPDEPRRFRAYQVAGHRRGRGSGSRPPAHADGGDGCERRNLPLVFSPSKEHPFGSNNYPGSAIRFYLNNEFFRGIPEEDAETLLTTCRPCTEHGEASSTCDLVWLLSASEVGFEGNGIPHEGRTLSVVYAG